MSSLEIEMHLLSETTLVHTLMRMLTLERFQLRRGCSNPTLHPNNLALHPVFLVMMMKVKAPQTGSSDAVRSSHKHDTEHDDVGAEAKRLHFSGYQDVPHGNVAPQTPASVAEDVLDDTPCEQRASPAKSIKHDGPGSINLPGCIQNVEHLDIELDAPLQQEDVDLLVQHQLDLQDEPYESEKDMQAFLKELSSPYTPQEPELSAEELEKLDSWADEVETQRLIGLKVLLPDALPVDCKTLSTRYVRTWRQPDGEAIWLRRSRLVAREFTWPQPDREVQHQVWPVEFFPFAGAHRLRHGSH